MHAFPVATFGAATIPTPSQLLSPYAWYRAEEGRFDATSGGSAVLTDGAAIARWEDQSGNARHLTQATSGNRPLYDVHKRLVVSAGPDNHYFAAPGSFTLDRQAFSFFIICELENLRKVMNGNYTDYFHFFTQASSDTLNLHYDGGYNTSNIGRLAVYDGAFKPTTTVVLSTGLTVLGFVGRTTGFEAWLEGASSSISALSSGNSTLTNLLGANSTHGPIQAGIKDLLVYSSALTSTQINNTILPYAYSRGVPSSRDKQLICEGDSITHGFSTTVNRNWPQRLTGIPGQVRRRVTAESGITLATLNSQVSTVVDPLFVSGQTNVLTIFAGTNDLEGGTSGSSAYSTLSSYCSARRTTGFKVVVFTMLDRSWSSNAAAKDSERSTFNSSIRSNWNTFADALVDVDGDSRLSDSTNTTYFNADGIHPNNAGAQVIAELANSAIKTQLGV